MPPPHLDRLVDHLADGDPDDPLAVELRSWMARSRRFRAFLEQHRDKVRKKLRTAREPEARLDVRAELAAADALLADRRLDLAFEASGARLGGPDFAVAFRGRHALNLEVTRWRGTPEAAVHGRPLLAKLRQLPTGIANVVLVAVGEGAVAPDPAAIADGWWARAGDGDDASFRRAGLVGAADFRTRQSRLGGVIVWRQPSHAGPGRATLWRSPTARITLPAPATEAVLAALEAGVGH